VAAYELLTGQKPFQGDTPEEILRRQLDRSNLITPRQLNDGIPPAVEKSILKSLDRDPDKRHPIMSVLVLELKAALYV
jgi:serine/threonine-protein kinase